jgi:hypothetical protein
MPSCFPIARGTSKQMNRSLGRLSQGHLRRNFGKRSRGESDWMTSGGQKTDQLRGSKSLRALIPQHLSFGWQRALGVYREEYR